MSLPSVDNRLRSWPRSSGDFTSARRKFFYPKIVVLLGNSPAAGAAQRHHGNAALAGRRIFACRSILALRRQKASVTPQLPVLT